MVNNYAPITVSQLNSYIKIIIDQDINLKNVYVEGEISNFKLHYASGHIYFSLKDKKSTIRAVMFASNAQKIKFRPKDGMSVIVKGKVSCYETSGQYQIYVSDIQPKGMGAVYLAFKQLKDKLSAEGLFDTEFKKTLPKYPNSIGVITSSIGAVIHDIQTVAEKRWPLCEIKLYSAEVQGENSPEQLIKGIEYFNSKKNADIIIIGRGGGSVEDLWAFNNENLARSIFSSSIPVISAVGHETDFTICDFVADKRAATPSAAAEIALPDMQDIFLKLEKVKNQLKNIINYKIESSKSRLECTLNNLKANSPSELINTKLEYLSKIKLRVKQLMELKFCEVSHNHEILSRRLTLCSPELTLKRGYTRISNGKKDISSYKKIKENDKIKINFYDGCITGNIINIKKETFNK